MTLNFLCRESCDLNTLHPVQQVVSRRRGDVILQRGQLVLHLRSLHVQGATSERALPIPSSALGRRGDAQPARRARGGGKDHRQEHGAARVAAREERDRDRPQDLPHGTRQRVRL